MLCSLKDIDGQLLIWAGVCLNALNLTCSRLVKEKSNWLHFLMGAAVAIAIFLMIVGAVKVSR